MTLDETRRAVDVVAMAQGRGTVQARPLPYPFSSLKKSLAKTSRARRPGFGIWLGCCRTRLAAPAAAAFAATGRLGRRRHQRADAGGDGLEIGARRLGVGIDRLTHRRQMAR